MNKVNLHNFHSHDGLSLLDGTCTPKQYIDAAMEIGLYGQGISNHGNCASVIEYYDYGKKMGYPVTLGEEFYVEEAKVIFADKEVRKTLNKYYHLIVIAKNKKGYQNLMKLSSLAFNLDRFYYRPRICFEDLFENKEGLIVTSACVGGPVGLNIIKGNIEKAHDIAKMFKHELQEDWFIEIETTDLCMDWDSECKKHYHTGKNLQADVNKHLFNISSDLNIEMLIGIDSHMIDPSYKKVQDVAIQTGPSSNGWHFHDTYALKTAEDVWQECQCHHPYISRSQFERMCNKNKLLRIAIYLFRSRVEQYC